MKRNENSYKKSGVNISLANKLVKHIASKTKKNVKKTKSNSFNNEIGGFGSLFDISNYKIKDPVIVSCTDGVGTKIDLANKFKKGMSWDNYGEWEIDHIRPCSSYNLKDPDQQLECFNYSNLQPLWKKENRKKSNKYKH